MSCTRPGTSLNFVSKTACLAAMIALISTKRLAACTIVAAALSSSSCDSYVERSAEDLDERLRRTIEEASDGRGVDFFLLPDSDQLAAIPQDSRNPLYAEKVELGRLLFHETALAVEPVREEGRGTYGCASCHHAGAAFQSAIRQAIGEGGSGFGHGGSARSRHPGYDPDEADAQRIRTMSPLNGAWQQVTFWNGQFGAAGPNAGTEARWLSGTALELNHLGYEGLETQAIAALSEHRMEGGPAAVAFAYPEYYLLFDKVFPDRTPRVSEETAGLAIAAFERTIVASRAPFQEWLRGVTEALTSDEKRGAILFFGKGDCAACHTGPALASPTFHALGMGDLDGSALIDRPDPADPVHFGRGAFTGQVDDDFRFRTPQLYNLADYPGFGHGASFATVREVIQYKNLGVPQNRYVSPQRLSPQFRPLGLSEAEVNDLTAFLERGLYDPDLARYTPRSIPSGNCFPTNDAQSRRDLGCDSAAQSTY